MKLLNAVKEPFILIGLDFRIISYNHSFLKLYHELYNQKIQIGDSIFKKDIRKARINEIESIFKKVLKGKELTEEVTYLKDNNVSCIFQILYSPARDEAGIISGIYISGKEITQLKEVQSQLESIVVNINSIVYRYRLNRDNTDEIVYLSDGSEHIWGIESDQIKKNIDLLWERIIDDDVDYLKRSMADSAKKMSQWKAEWRYRHPNGEIKWLRGIGNPIRQKDGSIVWDSLLSDISEEKNTSIELMKAKEYIRNIKACSQDIICTIDSNGFFSDVSEASLNILGYKSSELIGDSFMNLVYHEDHKRTLKAGLRVKEEKTPIKFQNRYVKKDGSLATMIWSAYWNDNLNLLFCLGNDVSKMAYANELELIEGYGEKVLI